MPVGREPHHLMLTPEGATCWSPISVSNEILILDPQEPVRFDAACPTCRTPTSWLQPRRQVAGDDRPAATPYRPL